MILNKGCIFSKMFLLHNKHLQAFFLISFFVYLSLWISLSLSFSFFLFILISYPIPTFRSTLAEGCLIWYYLQAFTVYNLSPTFTSNNNSYFVQTIYITVPICYVVYSYCWHNIFSAIAALYYCICKSSLFMLKIWEMLWNLVLCGLKN